MYLTHEEINNLLNKQDLTKNDQHCISLIIEKIKDSLLKYYNIIPEIQSGTPIVPLNVKQIKPVQNIKIKNKKR